MTLILDGEVPIFDDKSISRFEWFRKRPEDVASTPPIFIIRNLGRPTLSTFPGRTIRASSNTYVAASESVSASRGSRRSASR
jgi:hypothetical protein